MLFMMHSFTLCPLPLSTPIEINQEDHTMRAISSMVTALVVGAFGILPAHAQRPSTPVTVVNPVSLDPATTNPVTIVNSQRHPFSVSPVCDTTGNTCLVSVPTLTTQRMELEYTAKTTRERAGDDNGFIPCCNGGRKSSSR
jgi:hypothetical protein